MTLSSLACAANVGDNLTLSSFYTKDGVDIVALDAVNGKSSVQDLTLGNLFMYPERSDNNFTVTVSDLLASSTVSADDLLRLDSLVLMSRDNNQYTGSDRYITVQVNGQSTVYTSEGMVLTRPANYGYETLTFAPGNEPVFSLSDTLKVTVHSDGDNSFGFGAILPAAGVTVTSGTSYNWGAGYKQVIQLNATVTTPEPATATLSLLALAGLCARRRRH